MVKNEEKAIVKTLQPFIDSGIDSFVILDTGSTDSTISITKQLFEKHAIENGFIEQQPFVDFAISRNYALQCAEKKFPQAGFILMPDAEWQLHNVVGLLQFCKDHLVDVHDVYAIRIIMESSLDFFKVRLIRPNRGVVFVGLVHEEPNKAAHTCINRDIYFTLNATPESREKSKKRWSRDRDLLIDEYVRNPSNPRTVFYLAQTYESLQDWKNAALYYSMRCAMHGWSEENFMARYKLAKAYENDNKWPEAMYNYLEAFALRPTRAEPLIRIAIHYLFEKKYDLSFLFAKRATQIEYPTSDLLFIEKKLYDYVRYDILGQSAWYLGEFEIGIQAIQKALLSNYESPHLHVKLALYLGALVKNKYTTL